MTAARHFDNRVQLFLKYIMLNPNSNPLGHITDYKYRIEFQHRGSPHDISAWTENAPSLERNTESEINDFINTKISCAIPGDDSSLADLISQVQKHTHSITFRKHGHSCRFIFPRPLLNSSVVFKPLETPPSKQQHYIHMNILSSVFTKLEESEDWDSVDQLLNAASVTEKDALHWKKKLQMDTQQSCLKDLQMR